MSYHRHPPECVHGQIESQRCHDCEEINREIHESELASLRARASEYRALLEEALEALHPNSFVARGKLAARISAALEKP